MVSQAEAVVSSRLLGSVCIAVLVVILCLGLWPLHVPVNDVSWLGSRNGLRLGHYSTVIGAAPLAATGGAVAGSVEIWLEPARIWTGGTLLSFSQPDPTTGLRIKQSLTDLALERTSRGKTEKIYVDEVFRPKRPRFITVTSSASGTVIYLDGVAAKSAPRFRLSPQDLTGRLILGDAPGQTDTWAGMLFGAAVYRAELTREEVLSHYGNWSATGDPRPGAAEHCVALYLMNEHAGTLLHNQTRPGGELQIPPRYQVVDQIFLEPVWQEFSWSRAYWSAVFKNIVGFLPVGFVFYAYLAGVRSIRRGVLITTLSGTLISLTIEVLQAFLPTRDSGTSDLITNTFGTWLGVLLYLRLHRTLAAMLPWLPVFPKPRG